MTPFPEPEAAAAADLVRWAVSTYPSRFAVSTSFQKEGMVLVDLAARTGLPFRVFTLDTGRLPAATHQMIDIVQRRYSLAVEVVRPDAAEVDGMVSLHGPDLFYQSTDLRLLCCDVRKVRPLHRKLAEFGAWAVGLRRSQGETRATVPKLEQVDGRVKLSPLADWTAAQVDRYTGEHDVPVHPLYALGYTSIGCDPCTRAVEPGAAERSGRWWWEQDTDKECGIHFTPDGSPRRSHV